MNKKFVARKLLRFDAHLRVSDIGQAECYGTLFCAHYLNSSVLLSRLKRRVDSVVYTDREANLRREDDVMKFYKGTLLRMYNSDMRIEHCDRENAST